MHQCGVGFGRAMGISAIELVSVSSVYCCSLQLLSLNGIPVVTMPCDLVLVWCHEHLSVL